MAPLIAQADPGAGYRTHAAAINAAIGRVLRSGRYILGSEVAAFEDEFAAWLGGGYGVACGSGTDALILALQACGVGAGMTVATVSHTAVATVAAIELAGAQPLLLDVEPSGTTMDPAELAAVLARLPGLPPIAAVLPVHLYGQPADLPAIAGLCRDHGVRLIEDCSQAHGAACEGKPAGRWGDAAAFSFYPTKNLPALGDGGMVVAADAAVAGRVRRLREYGWDEARTCQEPGRNSRLDEIQSAILRVRLPLLAAANARRQAIAAAYDGALAGSRLRPPTRRLGCTHVFHQYVVRSDDRDRDRAGLAEAGIGTAVHYAQPIHRHPAYAGRIPLGPAGCRRTDTIAAEIISLPIYPDLTDTQVGRICTALRTVAV